MKKYLKIAALIVAIGLIIGLGYFANAMLGNPFSKYLAKKAVNTYIEENYSHLDVYVDKVAYSFKTTEYYARIKSESSIDTEFLLYLDWCGHITRDNYEDRVTSGYNTYARLDTEYKTLIKSILENPKFPYQLDFGGGSLQFLWSEMEDSEYGFGKLMSELEIDKNYDICQLGAELGVLSVYINDEEISVERAAEMILTIKALFDDAKIPFRVIDFNLRYPPNEDGTRKDGEIYTEIEYKDIYEEDMVKRVQKAYEAKLAYYEALDAESK